MFYYVFDFGRQPGHSDRIEESKLDIFCTWHCTRVA